MRSKREREREREREKETENERERRVWFVFTKHVSSNSVHNL